MKSKLRISCVIYFGVLFLCLFTRHALANDSPTEQGYDIIVVAGQSNTFHGDGPYEVDDTSKDSHIFQIGRFGAQNMQIIPAQDVLQFWGYNPKSKMIGFGMTFAREYVKSFLADGRKVLIVPVARGGVSIIDWDPDHDVGCKNGPLHLYSDMKSRIDAALAAPGTNRIVAFLWQQGETDIGFVGSKYKCLSGSSMTSANDYSQRIQSLLNRIRSDYSSQGNFSILVGEPVPNWLKDRPQFWQTKQDFINVMKSLPSLMSNVGFVSSDGLTSNFEDGVDVDPFQKVHFSARSQIKLGKRYAEVYKTIQANVPSTSEGSNKTISSPVADTPVSSGNVTVSGAVILKDGQPWIAKGATVVGLITTPKNYQYTSPAGPKAAQAFGSATLQAIKTVMHGDTVRFQVHQSILDPQSTYYDPSYVDSIIAPAVKMARDMGLVVILSMQHGWNLDPTGFVDWPTDMTLRAWQQLAPHFHSDRGVIYELYNEPRKAGKFPAYWQAWHDQHQPIIDYIRSIKAVNALIVDGPDQILKDVALSGISDPLNSLIYSIHPYPTTNGNNNDPSKWYPNFGYLAGVKPLLLTEWVMSSTTSCREDVDTFVVKFLNQIKAWNIPLLGWAMDAPRSLTVDYPKGFTLTSYDGFQCSPNKKDGGPGKTLEHYYETGEVSLM